MKKWNRLLKITAAAFALCVGLASFAEDERYSQVPDGAALVMNLNLGKLYSTSTFKAIAESGDVIAIRDDLKLIPWNAKGTIPDPIILYAPRMGSSYAMLVGTDKTPDELVAAIKARYGKAKQIETDKKGRLITVKYQKTDRKTKQKYWKTESESLYLTPSTVAFGRKDRPLDLGFFSGSTLPASDFTMLQNAPANAVAVGILRYFPIPAAEDPTGLSSLVESGDFIISEYEPGSASLVLNMECKGEKEAKLAVRRLNSFLRITLVTLFSADKKLFKELNSCYTLTSSDSKAKLEIKLSKKSLEKVRDYYLTEQELISTAADTVFNAADTLLNAAGALLK